MLGFYLFISAHQNRWILQLSLDGDSDCLCLKFRENVIQVGWLVAIDVDYFI